MTNGETSNQTVDGLKTPATHNIFYTPGTSFPNIPKHIRFAKDNKMSDDGQENDVEQGENNQAQAVTPHYASIKYALEAVPKFDGQRMPVEIFIEGCEDAKSMILPNQEKQLTQIIRNRLHGEARRATQGIKFDNISQLIEFLRKLYAPKKTLYELQGDMGRLCQGDLEGTISYTNRLKELAYKIIEAKREQNDGDLQEDEEEQLYEEFKQCLIRGLRPELEQRINKDDNFFNTIAEAIIIEKEIKAKESLRQQSSSKQVRFSRDIHLIQNEEIKCQICLKTGHEAPACPQRHPIKTIEPIPTGNENHYSSKDSLNVNFNQTPSSNNPLFKGTSQNRDFSVKPIQNNYTYPSRDFSSNNSLLNRNPPSNNFSPNGEFRSQNYANRNQPNNYARNGGNSFGNNYPSQNNHPSRNANFSKTCNYCKKPGHWIAECRKRMYMNSVKEQIEQNQHISNCENAEGRQLTGNAQRSPQIGAQREQDPAARRVMHIQKSIVTEPLEWPQLN